jgi:hypothetical protein
MLQFTMKVNKRLDTERHEETIFTEFESDVATQKQFETNAKKQKWRCERIRRKWTNELRKSNRNDAMIVYCLLIHRFLCPATRHRNKAAIVLEDSGQRTSSGCNGRSGMQKCVFFVPWRSSWNFEKQV